MKYRQGFVSNSSSSSFCIVGVRDDALIKEIIQKIDSIQEDDSFGYGYIETEHINFYGEGLDYCDYAGIAVENLLETKTIPQIKQDFVDMLKKEFNLEVSLDVVGFYFGEIGPG